MPYSGCPESRNQDPKTIEIKVLTPEARPSIPSIRLNALIIETIRQIKEDKKWMALIRQKALKNKITVDSMLYIDAKWMIENKGK